MTLSKSALLFFALLVLFSCHKNNGGEVPPAPPVNEKPELKLKDLVADKLPSPYYHFDYNDSGYITGASFASGLSFYDFTYKNGQIDTVFMNKDVVADIKKDKLVYDYENGLIKDVRIFDKTGLYYRKCTFTFSANHQLVQMDWYVSISGGAFQKEQTLTFTYNPDGNLQKINYQVFAVGPQVASTYQDTFSDYDDKLKADGFTLLHLDPFFLDFILVPSIHLQHNNPRKIIHTDGVHNYELDYTYDYDNQNRPVKKTGDFFYTSGTDSGIHVNIFSTYSYY